MSAPERPGIKRRLEEGIVWPLLDLRDWVMQRVGRTPQSKPMYEVHRQTRRQRFAWAVLDAVDATVAPVKRQLHRAASRYGGLRRSTTRVRAVLAAVPLALLAVVGVAAFTSDDASRDGAGSASAQVQRPAPPTRGQVAGVSDSAAERRERRAERRERAAERRADQRRAARRKQAAARRRAARRRAARRKRSNASAPAAPSARPPVKAPSSGAGSGSDFAPQPAPAPQPSAPAPPSGGGGGGGGGGGRGGGSGGGGSAPSQPVPSPGVEFDDQG